MNVRSVLPKDAIPSVDDPEFGTEYFGGPDDEVLVVEADQPRAYPIRILNYHEIVNDRVGGDPLAITWCPLCASAVVYESRAGGRKLTFGVSGKLADDDLVMYDRETASEWKQSLGECISGPLAGAELTVRPAGIVPYRRFREEYPDGVVLQRPDQPSEAASDDDEPAPVSYDEDPYREYFEGEGFGLGAHREDAGEERTWDRTDRDPKTVVLGVERDSEAVGYPAPRIEAAGGVVTDTVGETGVVVCATADGLHAFENPGYDFALDGDALRADGTEWDPVTGESADGRRLSRVPAQRLFAFAWQDDHGPGAFYEG
jgi:hypothetical protein